MKISLATAFVCGALVSTIDARNLKGSGAALSAQTINSTDDQLGTALGQTEPAVSNPCVRTSSTTGAIELFNCPYQTVTEEGQVKCRTAPPLIDGHSIEIQIDLLPSCDAGIAVEADTIANPCRSENLNCGPRVSWFQDRDGNMLCNCVECEYALVPDARVIWAGNNLINRGQKTTLPDYRTPINATTLPLCTKPAIAVPILCRNNPGDNYNAEFKHAFAQVELVKSGTTVTLLGCQEPEYFYIDDTVSCNDRRLTLNDVLALPTCEENMPTEAPTKAPTPHPTQSTSSASKSVSQFIMLLQPLVMVLTLELL